MQLCHHHFYHFLLWFHILLFFIALPCLYSAQAFFNSASHFYCFCVVNFFLIVLHGVFSCSFFSAISSRAFCTSLKSHSIPLACSSCFNFALNFSLSSVYISLHDSTLTNFEAGKLKAVQIVCNFFQILPLEMLPFLYLQSSSTKSSCRVPPSTPCLIFFDLICRVPTAFLVLPNFYFVSI